MTFFTNLFAKLGAWLLSFFLNPKNYKKVICLLLKPVINNIKNDGKKDWKDSQLLPVLEPVLKALEK